MTLNRDYQNLGKYREKIYEWSISYLKIDVIKFKARLSDRNVYIVLSNNSQTRLLHFRESIYYLLSHWNHHQWWLLVTFGAVNLLFIAEM